MSVKSVLIVGGSGFLGAHLATQLREGYKVFATYHKHPLNIPGVTCVPMNVNNLDQNKRQVYMASPDVVIYAAGRSELDWAEEESRELELVHVTGPVGLLKLVTVFQPRFIYLSSCYTFDGTKGNYRETDNVTGTSQLGKLKISGESSIRGRSVNYVILRSAPVLGIGNVDHRSLIDGLRMNLAAGKPMDLPTDKLHNFVGIQTYRDVVAKLIEGGPRNKVVHLGGLTKVSEYELGKRFAERYGYDPMLIGQKPGPTYKSDFSLNFTELAQSLKLTPRTIEESLGEIV